MSLTIQMRFGYDRNHDRKIDPSEQVGFSGLVSQDQNSNGVLEGRELTDVYFEYGTDQWLAADKSHRIVKDGWVQNVSMNVIDLKNQRIDMKIDMHQR